MARPRIDVAERGGADKQAPKRRPHLHRAESNPFYRNREHIADAALSPYNARCVGVAFELASKTKNLDIDASIEDILVNAGSLQQVLAAQRTLRGLEECDKHRVLSLGQRDG